jgi:DNA helicase-2/ATP-dependent DNA helicase PcrA
MNYSEFVKGPKTILISPAGYGKTFTIVECLKHTEGKQLVLTHTHAGVASIKEKIREAGISPSTYCIQTISSFAQKFVHAFCKKVDIPSQDHAREYHAYIIEKAATVFSSLLVRRVIASSYTGLFVDEYQDCSQAQHKLIQILSEVVPTHILGDPLQGIFDFNGPSVDMENDLPGFVKFPDLAIPQRWYREGNNKELGDILKGYRELLLKKSPIVLAAKNDIGFHVIEVNEPDMLDSKSIYRTKLDSIIMNRNNLPDLDSLLIMVPEYEETRNGQKINKGNISERAKIKDRIDYAKKLNLLEAIDDRLFYSLAKDADDLILSINKARKKHKKIKEEILDKLFPTSKLNEWFNNTGLIAKKKPADKVISDKISTLLDAFITAPSARHLYTIVVMFRKELKLKYKRDEVGRSFVTSLNQSHLNNTSVYEEVKEHRNLIRRTGRKVHGKCIGTTLLTKGLEFDTVVLLDAHRFDSPNHLYVALTRCCKRLIIFTSSKTLSPY